MSPALWSGELDAVLHLFAKQISEQSAVGEVHRNVDGARYVGLIQVELLEQGGEEAGGGELLADVCDGGALDRGAAKKLFGLVVLGGGLRRVRLECGEIFGLGDFGRAEEAWAGGRGR